MPANPRFTEDDIIKALQAVASAGFTPTKIEIGVRGQITVSLDHDAAEAEDINQYIGPTLTRRAQVRGQAGRRT